MSEPIRLDPSTRKAILDLVGTDGVWIEGSFLEFIDTTNDKELEEYIKKAKARQDKSKSAIAQKDKTIAQLKDKLKSHDNSSKDAGGLFETKTKFRMIESIVKTALAVIFAVGGTVTALYVMAIFTGRETQLIGNTWSNLLGILLTNSFSIVGTIMGVRYADTNKDPEND